VPDVITEIWDRATAVQPIPDSSVVIVTGLVALALVLVPFTWRRVRLGITAVHEAGHAAVGVLVGRRLQGIRLHSDTSGLTVSSGKPTGPGMLATLLAGYLAPALVGLGAVFLLTRGYAVGLLWLVVVLLVVLLLWIRNLYGFAIVLVAIASAGALSWYASAQTQSAAAYLLAWTLLLAAPRPVVELLLAGARRSRKSDPDQLARLTRVPAVVWILLMLGANLAGLVLGATTLAPDLHA
jgi:hypothetical protein